MIDENKRTKIRDYLEKKLGHAIADRRINAIEVNPPYHGQPRRLIEVGKSTKADVVRILGAPTDIIFCNREHDPLRVFAYEYVYKVSKTTGFTIIIVTFLNSDAKRDHVLVFFDENGVVSGVGTSLDAEKASYEFPFGD